MDIVAKNGCMLLNVGPRADGTIPDKAKTMLREIGAWLRVNGEAIYGTRPWISFGEGPTGNAGGAFSEQKDASYTASDIRFTTKRQTLYAIALAWPDKGDVLVKSLPKAASRGGGEVTGVSLLGHKGSLEWSQTADGLRVRLPSRKPCEYAFSFKIEGNGLPRSAPSEER